VGERRLGVTGRFEDEIALRGVQAAHFTLGINRPEGQQPIFPILAQGKPAIFAPSRASSERFQRLDRLIFALTAHSQEVAAAPDFHDTWEFFRGCLIGSGARTRGWQESRL
jgi:hypothetical protein